MSAEIIVLRTRERIAADSERLHFMRAEQARTHNAEVAEKTRRLAELMAAYRQRHPYNPTPPTRPAA